MQRKVTRLTQAQFYAACESLKNNREKFEMEQPRLAAAALMLSGIVNFTVTKSTMQEIKSVTNISWKEKPRKINRPQKYANRAVVIAIVRLYKKLGEEVPSTLLNLYESYKDDQTVS